MSNEQTPGSPPPGSIITSAPNKNFGLTPAAFTDLVARLNAGDETLFQTIFLAHFEDCMNYIKRKFGLSHDKAYDCTMDTMLLFRRRLLEGKISYGNIRFLFTRMASQLYLKAVDKQPVNTEISEAVNMLEGEEEDLLDADTLTILNQAWDKLGQGCQGLLKRFYYHKRTLKEIAEEQQKTAAALRKQKQRCVEKLRMYFNELNPM